MYKLNLVFQALAKQPLYDRTSSRGIASKCSGVGLAPSKLAASLSNIFDIFFVGLIVCRPRLTTPLGVCALFQSRTGNYGGNCESSVGVLS